MFHISYVEQKKDKDKDKVGQRANQLDAEFRAATSLAEKREESVGFLSYIEHNKYEDKRQIHRQRQREQPPAWLRRLRSRWVLLFVN